MLGAHGASGKVHVGQRVELGDYDVDVVGADAVADTHYRLPLVGAANGVELARRNLEGLGVEKRCHHVNSARIAHQDDSVG
jgi:hypothetical protein